MFWSLSMNLYKIININIDIGYISPLYRIKIDSFVYEWRIYWNLFGINTTYFKYSAFQIFSINPIILIQHLLSIFITNRILIKRRPSIIIPTAPTSNNRNIIILPHQHNIQRSFFRQHATIGKDIYTLTKYFCDYSLHEIREIWVLTD